jgi:hypothetical protein
MLVSVQVSRCRRPQTARRSINDQWGELTRLGFDELCTSA